MVSVAFTMSTKGLTTIADVDAQIQTVDKQLVLARDAARIRTRPEFRTVTVSVYVGFRGYPTLQRQLLNRGSDLVSQLATMFSGKRLFFQRTIALTRTASVTPQ